jgi:foldase protein PrsA
VIKTALTILAVAVAGTGFVAHGGGLGEAVATVDGRAIEQRTFDHWLTITAKSLGSVVPDPATGYRRCIAAKRKAMPAKVRRKVTDARLARECKQDHARLRDQVMQLLLSFEWVQGEAAMRNIIVTDAEVTQSFQEQKQQSFPKDVDYQKYLRSSGQTQGDIIQRVRLDLLSNKLRDSVVAGQDQISDQAIAQFYDDHRPRFAEPEKRALRLVLTKHEADARRARAALERGTSWKAVAKRYSIDDASKRAGGKLGAVAKNELDRKLAQAVFSAMKHRLGGPIRTQFGYYVFMVTDVEPARQRPLAEVTETIKDILVAEAQQAALDAFVRDFTARWRAKTECAAGYETSDCRNGPPLPPTPTPTPTA